MGLSRKSRLSISTTVTLPLKAGPHFYIEVIRLAFPEQPVSKENILDYIVECGRILNEQSVPLDDRWIALSLTPYHRKKRIRKKWLHRRYPFLRGTTIWKEVWKTSGLLSQSSSSKLSIVSVPTPEMLGSLDKKSGRPTCMTLSHPALLGLKVS